MRERFWCPGDGGRPGFFALALDGEKRRVDSIASNMGHLLWCDVPDDDEAGQVARHLVGEGLASGWGLRTLSAEMAGYNPISYHVGSVWPHDTAMACEGLRRYGLDGAAMRLAGDLIDALALFEDRLPELFGGHPRAESEFPVPYPTACRPQAWAAGVPLSFVPLLLGLEPDVPAGTVSLNPVLPPDGERRWRCAASRCPAAGSPSPSTRRAPTSSRPRARCAWSWAGSAGREAPVDGRGRARDVGRPVPAEEEDGRGHAMAPRCPALLAGRALS